MKDVKVEIFAGSTSEVEECVNQFIQGKTIVDIKLTSSDYRTTVLIIYQSNSPEPA